jgi:peptide/nickel transport system substrate-binding protein
MYMRTRKGLLGLTAVGLTVALIAPAASAATATTKKKAASKTKTTTKPTTAPTTAKPPAGNAAPAAPKSGGKAVWGLEAESSEGYLPSSSNCAISCFQVYGSMAERLLSVDKDGKVGPWLAESFSNDPSYKVWTFKLKTGVKFHNGEVFDAAAAKVNLDDIACGSVTTTAWFPLNGFGQLCRAGKLATGVEAVDATTLKVTLPIRWVSLPSYLAAGQTYMMAPSQINAKERNKPVGTGPFKFKEWIVGDRLNVVRNDDYWGKKALLDEVEYRPIPDESARLAQLQSGQVDFMQTSNLLTIGELKDLAKGNKIKFSQGSPTFGEVSYDMLNVGVAPFNNKDCRLAAAHGQDTATLIKLRAPGSEQADGPFAPGSLGYLPDSGYPKFNLDKAKDFFGKCKAALGGGDVSFTIGTTTVPDNIQTAQIQKQMMEQVGFKVSLVNIEQQKYIGVALVGAYQWFQWRSHGGFDPDQQRIWWHNEMNPRDAAGRLKFDGATISINLNRIADTTIDDAFDKIRGNSDPAVRKKSAEDINQAMADNAYSLWRWRTIWGVGYCTKCSGVTGQKTAAGAATQDFPTGHVFDMAALSKG